jgi:hypothetical protein
MTDPPFALDRMVVFLHVPSRREGSMRHRSAVLGLVVLCGLCGACTALQQLSTFVQPPRFDEAPGQRHEIRLLSPAADRPLGGAAVRLWTRATNPNAFAFTLGTLRGTLYLRDASAATAEFPLGLPLAAHGETTFPIDLTISFADLPGLADVIRRAAEGDEIAYRFDGTISVETTRFGTPTFGPMTLLRGTFGLPAMRSRDERPFDR